MEFLHNVCPAHLQLLMNTSAKCQANWTETVGGTSFCGQTDRLTAQLPDRLCLRGYNNLKYIYSQISIPRSLGDIHKTSSHRKFNV